MNCAAAYPEKARMRASLTSIPPKTARNLHFCCLTPVTAVTPLQKCVWRQSSHRIASISGNDGILTCWILVAQEGCGPWLPASVTRMLMRHVQASLYPKIILRRGYNSADPAWLSSSLLTRKKSHPASTAPETLPCPHSTSATWSGSETGTNGHR